MARKPRKAKAAARPEPKVVIQGLEQVIERDLDKHRMLLERTANELAVWRAGRSHEIRKKKHYAGLIRGQGPRAEKYDKEALRAALDGINVNIQHLSDKCQGAEEKIAHHAEIVDTLTAQLAQQKRDLAFLAAYRERYASGD